MAPSFRINPVVTGPRSVLAQLIGAELAFDKEWNPGRDACHLGCGDLHILLWVDTDTQRRPVARR